MNQGYIEPSARKLLSTLWDFSCSDSFMLGHQNAAHIGVSVKTKDGSESDIKKLTGKHPAVVGIDTLSFYGYEGKYNELVTLVKNLNKEGVIVTLSSHMPNFDMGGEMFFDYSSNVTDGNVGKRIMPGGDLNGKYIKFLDKIADFASECIDVYSERIPMIFRPFHEGNGDWFWWGKSSLSDEEYIKLYRYTVDYLRDIRGVRTILFCYSPNGPFTDSKDYLLRYPGDDYVDLLGFDYYNDRPSYGDGFWESLKETMLTVSKIADSKDKPFAVTEIGLRTLDSASEGGYYEGLAPIDNNVKDWFSQLLDLMISDPRTFRAAYILFWANFSDVQFWVPYETMELRHEMCDDFIKLASDPHVKSAPVKG